MESRHEPAPMRLPWNRVRPRGPGQRHLRAGAASASYAAREGGERRRGWSQTRSWASPASRSC